MRISLWDNADTVELPGIPTDPDIVMPAPPPNVVVESAGLSDRGKVRPNNEDHFLIIRLGRFMEVVQSNLPKEELTRHFRETGYGMVVADGIGGHAAGEVASKKAISTLLNLVLQTPDWIFRLDDDARTTDIISRAVERFAVINKELSIDANADPNLKGFGTTMTAAWNVGNVLFVANIGDSRAYLLRGDELRRLTTDHTLAQAMADAAIITQEQANVSRHRHMLTKSLGDGKDAKPDARNYHLEDGDYLLLCTDGLTDMLPDATIAAIMSTRGPAATICQSLVDQALRAGGKDNVSVVVAHFIFAEG
jgi:serine/threonine protein phosphatase PrpC